MLRPVQLADVLVPRWLTVPGAVLAASAVLKSLDLSVRWAPWVAVLWVLAAAMCALHLRAGALSVSLLAMWAMLWGPYSNHLVWLFWLGLTFVLFTDPVTQRYVVRWQLSILYGFAAIAKVHAPWLSGAALTSRGLDLPFLDVIVVAVIAVEIFLAVGLWVRAWRRGVIATSVAVHLGFMLAPDPSTLWGLGLVVFGVSSVGALIWATAETSATEARPTPTRAGTTP